MFTPKTSKLGPFGRTKVLLRNAVLLLGLITLLTIFIIATVNRNNDLHSHSDDEISRIGEHRPSFDFHRTKRGFWDIFGERKTELICPAGKWPCSSGVCIDQDFRCDEHLDCLDGSDEANCLKPDEPQTGQANKPLPLIAKNDTGGQQKDLDENVPAVPTLSQKQKKRYITHIFRVEGDDEDGYGSEFGSGLGSGFGSDLGSGKIEGSADKGNNSDSHLKPDPDIDVKKPVPSPGPESKPEPETLSHFYRVTMIINEPYIQSLADRNSDEFKDLSIQLSQAIDGLYKFTLPDQRTHTKILKFVQTSDPFAIWVTLDINSTSPDVEKNRSILAEQLQLHTLGNIQARPDGFSLKNVQELEFEECEFETEFRCRSDGECITITSKCDGIIQCIDGSDEADCSPLESTTIVEVPEVNTDPLESLLEEVENEADRIDNLIETVQRMKDALEELTTANKLLTQKIVELQMANSKKN